MVLVLLTAQAKRFSGSRMQDIYLADLGEDKGCSTNPVVIDCLINLVSPPLPKRRRRA